ncbi:MAG: cytochrome P450 [Anaerolineales bacterium]
METKTVRPDGFSLNPYRVWQLVNRPQSYTAALRKQYGEIVALYEPSEKAFVIALTPNSARQILSADPAVYDAFWKEGFTGVAGSGSLWVLGKNQHRRERQLLSPTFHAQNFRGYGEVIREITNQKTEKWQSGETLRALDTTLDITLDIIMRLVFGAEEGKGLDEGRKIVRELWRTMHPLFVFFPKLQRWWFPPWVRYARAKDKFSKWTMAYLAERRSCEKSTDDILGRMLAAEYEDGTPMRDEDIRDELITILLAGHETTATALAWALYELGKNPDILETLRKELDSLGTNPTPEQVAKAPYLTAVCNETLRLHTLLPEIARELVAPLELSGHTLLPGDSVGVSVMAIHHDPELYPEPDRFIPERFIGRNYSPFEFLPFGGGHRRCLGSGLSDYEMKISLAEIATRWEFEPAGVEREIRHDIAMGPKNGCLLRIKGKRTTTKTENSQTGRGTIH